MDDLVVIILTLLIAGAGIIGQLKKKKQATSTVPSENQTPEDIWSLFRQETFFPNLNAEPENLNIDQEESESFENEQNYEFEAKNEGGILINKELKAKPVAKDIITKKKERFPLRKAVIYSEILNSKYI